MKMMKLRLLVGAFFGLYVVVVCAQDKQQPAGAKPVSVSNFPTREEAKRNWDIQNPKGAGTKEAAPSAGQNFGPAGSPGPSAGQPSGGKVAAEPLPDPKIDYPQEALERVAPMTAEDLRKFADLMYERSKEMSRVPGGHYKLRGSRQVMVNLNPGAEPEKISIALGMGAMVSFIDRTGAPLTVDAIQGFSPSYKVQVMETEKAKAEGAHIFSIEAQKITGQGNVSVQLKGILTPYSFNVVVGESKDVDSHVQFVWPTVSGKRSVLPGDRMEADGNLIMPEMQEFLAGIPPEGAVEIEVPNVVNTKAWMWKKRLYLRTHHAVFTPGFFRRQGSVEGMTVYELPLTPVVRLGVEGREVMASLNYPYIPSHSNAK